VPESETPREISFAPNRGPRRRRRIGAGVALVAGSAVAVGIVLGAGPSSSQGANKPAKSSGAATVARRDLVSTDTESGTLGYANAQTVFNRLSGTITSLPAVGQVIDAGRTLYHVDGAPVVLFDGGTPAYRDLSAGVSNGLDVQELKRNLKALGFDPSHQITVNQTFDAATTAAVDRWQASLGQTQTGTVTLGQIVFLPGPQRITKVDTVLGSTGGTSSGSATSATAATTSGTPATGSTLSASTALAAPRAEFVDLTSTVAATTTTPATTTTTTTPTGTGSGKGTTTCPKPSTTGSGASQAIRQTQSQIAALCSQPTTASSKTAQQTLAALIALLKAETLLLKRGSGSSSTGTGSGSPGTGTSGGSGGSRSGGGSAAGTGASSASTSSGGGSASGGSSGGGSGSASPAGSGSASGGGTVQAILQTTSTQLVVTVNLDATKQSEAVVGRPVTVQLPTGGTVDGKITGVSPVAQSASSSSSSSSSGGGGSSSSTPSATIPVTITLKGRQTQTGVDQAAVSVNFEQQVENNVLSVPVTALLATSGGGYSVQEASAPHRLIPVTPGLFAAGFVQVSGAGIYPGLAITDSQG
jgi:hypothetical protein